VSDSTEEVELKRCPFCGGRAMESSDAGCRSFVVCCVSCSGRTEDHGWGEEARQKAISEWNRRSK